MAAVTAALSLLAGNLVIAGSAQAADPPCGPVVGGVYQVSTAAQLQAVGSGTGGACLLSDSYQQIADIVLPAPVAPATSNFTPIGTNVAPFTGAFDGGDYIIRGLTLDYGGSSVIGLFRRVEGATLSHIHLIDANVTGDNSVGALVGEVRDEALGNAGVSTLSDSSSTGRVTGVANVGGLIGLAFGNPALQQVTMAVTRSTSSATVTATGNNAGGLLGGISNTFELAESFATGSVTGRSAVGGLVGECCSANASETTIDSFSRSDTEATAGDVGGLFGATFSSNNDYRRLYGTGTLSGSAIGGLEGFAADNGTWISSFWDTASTATRAVGRTAANPNPTNTSGKSSAQLRDIATFNGWPISAGVNGNTVWGIDPAVNDGFPFLSWSVRELAYSANGGASAPANQATLVWEDVTVAASAGMTRPGFTFTSWNTRADGTGTTFAPGDSVTVPWNSREADTTVTTLYAQWAAIPPPPVPTPASPPRDVAATGGDASAEVSWAAPSSSGSFPVSNYQVIGSPSGSCLVSATFRACAIADLTNGEEYSFRVRALTGAGWGAWSEPVSVMPQPPAPEPSILISGSREGSFVMVSGQTTGLVGEQVVPRVRFPGPKPGFDGKARPVVDEEGNFTWQRRTNKKTYVYFFVEDVRSNRVIIKAR